MRRPQNLRFAPSRVRGVLAGWVWGHRALRQLRRELGAEGLQATVHAPRSTTTGTLRGTNMALRQGRATCLERSLVVQRWLATRGEPRPIIIGVRSPGAALAASGATAHAWIEHYDADHSATYAEIRRIPPPNVPARAQ